MKVVVERDSVCMGDDCFAPHTRKYILDDNATYMELFEIIKNDNYLPSMNNVVWVLTNEQYSCIFSYFSKTAQISISIQEKFLKTICKGSNKLRFKYYYSPQNWKEHIYRMYNNDEYTMQQDGWFEEVKYCDFLMQQ